MTRKAVGARAPLALILSALVGAGCVLGGVAAAETVIAAIGIDRLGEAGAEVIFDLLVFMPMAVLALVGARVAGCGFPALGTAPLRALLAGVAIGGSGLSLAAGYAWLARTSVVAPPSGAASVGPSLTLLAGVAITLVQAGSEELLLRGWLQPALAARWPAASAVAVSALVFMALHMLGGARGLLELCNLFLGGVLFGVLALRAGGLAAAIGAHWAWNSCESFVFGLDPNPGVSPFGSLVDLDMAGNGWWGGSAQGLNGSAAMTIVLAALILPFWTRAAGAGVAIPSGPAPVLPPKVADRNAWLLGEPDRPVG